MTATSTRPMPFIDTPKGQTAKAFLESIAKCALLPIPMSGRSHLFADGTVSGFDTSLQETVVGWGPCVPGSIETACHASLWNQNPDSLSDMNAVVMTQFQLRQARAMQEDDGSRPLVDLDELRSLLTCLGEPGPSAGITVSPSLRRRKEDGVPRPIKPMSAGLMLWLESGSQLDDE